MAKRKAKESNNTIKSVVRKCLDGWKFKQWEQMYQSSTLTFKAWNKEAYFINWLGDTKLINYEVVDVLAEKETPAKAVVTIKVKADVEGLEIIKQYDITLIREQTAYIPSSNGRWGVTPATLLLLFNPNIKPLKE